MASRPTTDGTVRGGFDLDGGPARRQLKDLRKEALATDKAMVRLGKSMDKVGGPKHLTQVKAYRKELAGVKRTVTEVERVHNQKWKSMTRQVEVSVSKQETVVEGLHKKLKDLGRERVSPKIDLDGVAEALAQVELLERRLNSLGRSRSTPSVGLGGGFPRGMPAGGGGGGGGGMRGGVFAGTNGVGFATGRTRTLAAVAVAALPVIQAVTGAATGLLGVLGGATLGAGAVTIAGGGALAAGMGTIAAVAIPMTKRIGEASKAQQKYNQTVAQYGRDSEQAIAAQDAYNKAVAAAPRGTRRFLSELKALNREWGKASRGGQDNLMGFLRGGVGDVRALTGTAGRAATKTTGAVRREGGKFGKYMRSGQSRGFMSTGASIFNSNLGNVRGVGENVMTTMGNVMTASSPFFKEGTTFIREWTMGWRRSTNDIDATRDRVGGMVKDLKSVGSFSNSGLRLLKDLFNSGRPEGRGLLQSGTDTMNRWDAWIKANPAKVQQFFRDTIDNTKKLGSAIGQITQALNGVATVLGPLLANFSQLVTGAGQLGLLTPGVGALAYGAMGRGRGRGGGGGGGGGFFGGAAAGAAGAGGYSTWQKARGAYRAGAGAALPGGGVMVGAGSRGAGLRAGAGALGVGAKGAAIGAGKAYLPIGLAIAALTGAGYQGGLGDKTLAAANSFTLGLTPAPESSAQRSDKAGQWLNSMTRTKGLSNQNSPAALARLEAARSGIAGNAGQANGRLTAWLTGKPGQSIDDKNTLRQRVKVLDEEIKARKELIRTIGDQKSMAHAGAVTSDIQKGYSISVKRGVGQKKAMGQSVRGALGKIGNMRDSGAMPVAESTLKWAKAQAKANPELLGQVRKLERGIKRRFSNISKHVQIVNGQILTGTKKEWAGIQSAISTRAEQARQDTQSAFTAIQRQAVGSLTAMGFSKGQATRLVQGLETGGSKGKLAKDIVGDKNKGQVGPLDLTQATGDKKKNKARGGRVAGNSLQDTTRMPDGSKAAGGELIVNRHTEKRINAKLGGRTTIGREVGMESRKHSDPMKKKTRTPACPGCGKSHKGGCKHAKGGRLNIIGLGNWLQGKGYAVGEHPAFGGVAGVHVPGSYHYKGQAIDVNADNFPGGEMKALDRIAPQITAKGYHVLWRTAGHFDHLHADTAGAGSTIGKGMGSSTGGPVAPAKPKQIKPLKAPRAGYGGSPGAMVNRAGAIKAAGLTQKINSTLRAAGPGGGGGGGGALRGGGRTVGASMYGGPNDTDSGVGYRGDNLSKTSNTFAELSKNPGALDFSALGGLPYKSRLKITGPTGSAVGVKRDVGAGGGAVEGHRRDIDLHHDLAAKVGINGLGLVKIQNAARGKRMGGPAWGGWNKKGGSFRTNGPTLFGAGEDGQSEDVHITKAKGKRPKRGGGRAGGGHTFNVTVNFNGVTANSPKSDLDAAAKYTAKKIKEAIEDFDGEKEELLV